MKGTVAGNMLGHVWGKRRRIFGWTAGYMKGRVAKIWKDVPWPDWWGVGNLI